MVGILPTLKISGGKLLNAFLRHHWPRPLNLDVGRVLVPGLRDRATTQLST
jgi:hypothetical protein